jgi:hypothetical protein
MYVDWGDGSTTPVPEPFSGNTSCRFILGHTFDRAGTHTVTLRVTDTLGGTIGSSIAALITDPPITAQGAMLAGTGLQPFVYRGVVAHADDPDTSDAVGSYTVRIAWGDGHVSRGWVTRPGCSLLQCDPNGLDIHGSHLYARPGTYRVVVRITDNDGSTASAVSKLVVA